MIKHAFAVAMLFLLAACAEPEQLAPPKVGEVVPDLAFVDLDGRTLQLAQLRGKVVVVHFWATWCPPCRRELPGMERLAQRLDGDKYAVLAVSVDEEPAAVRQFKQRFGIRFANHIDQEMALAKGAFGVSAYPETFLIGRDGKLLRHMRGEHEWDSPAMMQVLEAAYRGNAAKAGEFW
jgi:thiol-disulfide isomerase/thioredoxin